MLATRWQPFGGVWTEMNRLQNEMNRLLGRFGAGDGLQAAPSYPALNLWQDGERLYVEAELPGMELADLEIYVTGGDQLTIKGRREAPKLEKGTWHRQERGYGEFTRLLTLPHMVDADKVEAEFRNGVLTIVLPKHETAKPRRIEVKAE